MVGESYYQISPRPELDQTQFIQYNYWDSGHQGLLSGEALFLGLPDRFVSSEGEEAERAIEAIADCVREIGAGSLFVSWRHDPHCDHQASYRIVRAVQRSG